MEMSDTAAPEKSEDKKEIEDEEKERMLNEENKERGGEEEATEDEKKKDEKKKDDEEEEEEGGKGKVQTISNVIGSIKVPSFLKRPRDGGKDGNADTEEGKDLLDANPNSQASGNGPKSRLAVFEKIRLPKPFSKKNKEKPQDSGGNKNPGGEEDNSGGGVSGAKGTGRDEKEGEKSAAATGEPDDGMETVKLESDVEKQDGDKESLKHASESWGKYEWQHRVITTVSKHRLIIAGVLLFILLLVIIIAIAASSGGGSQQDALDGASRDILHVEGRHVTAITSCGPVQGWVEGGGFAFRGIPYALPPVGKMRWQPPVLLESLEHCWDGTLVTRNSSLRRNTCWHTFWNGSVDGSEDCLTVDVFAPRVKRNGPRSPVVVLVATETLSGGGGKGSISPQLLSPQLARAAGVIFVRVNFRLGVIGFFSARALSRSVHPPRSGNYGLADVRAALKWVKLNAMAFGGDPSSITVLGHRAGATLVLALAASHKASRLFTRAWLSGPAAAFPRGDEASLMNAEKEGETLVQSLQCGGNGSPDKDASVTAACLLRVDPEDLLDTVPEEWRWNTVDLPARGEDPKAIHHWLIVDGEVLNQLPLQAWEQRGLQVPLVIGTTSHGEATAELRRRKDWTEPRTVAEHVQDSAIGEAGQTEEALRLYSSPSFPPSGTSSLETPPPLARLTAMVTDIRSICPLLNFTRSAARLAKNVPVFFYVAASLPEEAGAIGAVPNNLGEIDEIDVASALIGPGADLAAILSHPIREYEGGQSSAIARMFYTYVRHGPSGNSSSSNAGDNMEKVDSWPESKMPNRLLVVSDDGRVESISDYPRCDFWTKTGIVPRFARMD